MLQAVKYLIFFLCICCVSNHLQSQRLKIGSRPTQLNSSSLLELESDSLGLLLPRVNLVSMSNFRPLKSHVAGMHIYNLTTAFVGTDTSIYPGEYYNNGSKWIRIGQSVPQTSFFFMPSIAIRTDSLGTGFTIDLYEEYKKQFDSPLVRNPSSPSKIPFYRNRTDFDYYITYFPSTTLANLSVSDNGILTYSVIGSANECSYVNIVFVPKN